MVRPQCRHYPKQQPTNLFTHKSPRPTIFPRRTCNRPQHRRRAQPPHSKPQSSPPCELRWQRHLLRRRQPALRLGIRPRPPFTLRSPNRSKLPVPTTPRPGSIDLPIPPRLARPPPPPHLRRPRPHLLQRRPAAGRAQPRRVGNK